MLSVSFKRKETDLMDKRDITVEKKDTWCIVQKDRWDNYLKWSNKILDQTVYKNEKSLSSPLLLFLTNETLSKSHGDNISKQSHIIYQRQYTTLQLNIWLCPSSTSNTMCTSFVDILTNTY